MITRLSYPEHDSNDVLYMLKIRHLLMLENEGYDISEDIRYIYDENDMEDYYIKKELYINEKITGRIILRRDLNATYIHNNKTMKFVFLSNDGITIFIENINKKITDVAKKINRGSEKYDEHIIIFTPEKLSSASAEKLKNLGGSIFIENRLDSDIINNPMNHSFHSKDCKKLSAYEKKLFFDQIGSRTLPKIYYMDKLVIWLEANINDIIKITRDNIYSGGNLNIITYYLIVSK